MLAAIILSANHGLAEGENDRAMIAGFGRAHFAHDRARLGGGDVTRTLLILMVRLAASIGDGPHPAAGFGDRLRFEIGRASCRAGWCHSVSISVVAVYLKNTTH